MKNRRGGLKEVANVIFFDVSTNKPVIFFDTLKVSTIENESESAEARGGQGNSKLLSWDFGRSATLTLQDALLSDVSLSLLAGTQIKRTNIKANGRETLTLAEDANGGVKVTLKETPVANSITVFKMENGVMQEEVTGFTADEEEVVFATGLEAGKQVMVIYDYLVTNEDATQVTFSGNAFPATYRVVGETVIRGEDGVDRKMQFHIPKAKLQSTFSLTMDVENVSTFDFNLEVLTESGSQRLYDIIRL